jgi:prepilin-type N-terminal cleavage/methylation domain-containing protein
MQPTMTRAAGFTLIELLVVISILTLLVVAFAPDLIGAGESAKAKDTEGRRLLLDTGIEAFGRQHGYLPPSDMKDPEDKLKQSDTNNVNTGIESLVLFLGQGHGGIDLSEHAGWLADTDKDSRKEVVDAWGTPFAYFSSTTAGSFEQPQKIRLPDEAGDVSVVAWKSPEGPLGQRKYQMVSAGKDRTFNTEDDIVWPERK